jgi:hypothetical protein|tara:strand:+ start:2305 stop:2469 length:165 start_codon:yes stop_codon:yes gene_type:complete
LYKDKYKIRLPFEVLADIAEDSRQLPLQLKQSQIIKTPVKKKRKASKRIPPETD